MKETFEVQIAHSVTEIDRSVWDHLTAGRHFASYRWYSFGEHVFHDCLPTHVVLSHRGEIIARATFWLKKQEWLPITSRILRFGVEQLLQHFPLMMCSVPLACMPGLILPQSSSREDARRELADIAFKLAVEQKASFSIFSYIGESEARQSGWPEAYWPVSFSDAETSLEISWTDFDGYLRHLAKSTRRNYKLHCRQATEMGVRITKLSSVPDIEKAIELISNVERHHRMGRRPWSRAVLENTEYVDFTWITAHIEDRFVGCCALIRDGEAQLATLLGLDYSVDHYIYVYYTLMYEAVRSAIERGVAVLYGGGGAYEFKRRMGFRKLPDDCLMVAAARKPFGLFRRGMAGTARSAKLVPGASEDTDPSRLATCLE